jgi:hypothetical protein
MAEHRKSLAPINPIPMNGIKKHLVLAALGYF